MIPSLGEDLILGTDYANFTPLLEKACQEDITSTRWEEAPYGTAKVEEIPLRKKLSRKQKREQRQEYHATPTPDSHKPSPRAATVLTTVGSFRQAQREDPTLKNAWQQALRPDGRSLRTSVYHPQTDGLVERYNKTIKTLLRKVISKVGKDWERKLPLVLYAIRTHVQASTGHSPFELLFERQPLTLLEMLAEQLEESEEEVKDILTYTKELKEGLHTVWEEAHTALRDAQNKQKRL
ncbi:hypothetical protein NDU88_006786 [Pleurodeles waltl]|uniref:Integrase catalytic domain-containing protein n=1 Tax=Pleurodeles waltl TaxID=8319 RepID=A0AAV7P0D3_PLEWA|nr:hypothetical protein NDU88_006786 [Pleurodeles waltl]